MTDSRPALLDLPSFECLTQLLGLPTRRQHLFDAYGASVGVVAGTRNPPRLALYADEDCTQDVLHLYEMKPAARLGPIPLGRSGDWTVFTPDGRRLGSVVTRTASEAVVPSTTPPPWRIEDADDRPIGRVTMRFHWLQVVPFVGELSGNTSDVELHGTPAAVCTRRPSLRDLLFGRPAVRSRVDLLPTHHSDDDRLLALAVALLAAR